MRKVSVYSSLGDNVYENISATTWGELKPTIEADYGSLSSLKVFEKVTRAEYSVSEAVLPEGDFVLFIYQSKNKSGASYTQMRDRIKSLKDAFGSEAREHFGNYTILPFNSLETLLNSWDENHRAKETVAIVKKTVTLEEVAKVIGRKIGYTTKTILDVLEKEFGVTVKSDPNKEEYEKFGKSFK